jgi:hypothetical protein
MSKEGIKLIKQIVISYIIYLIPLIALMFAIYRFNILIEDHYKEVKSLEEIKIQCLNLKDKYDIKRLGGQYLCEINGKRVLIKTLYSTTRKDLYE